tara:strand:- start:473 stop:1804 length:1332 start_codon:yes stop_codon:yes gene_type:complete
MDNVDYSGVVKNTLLDPVLDVKNVRTEFRIDNDDTNRVLLPNLRLAGVGVSCAGAPHYNFVAGASGVIKNIFLMDGNVVLDQCRNANGWLAFQNYLGFNDQNASKFGDLQKKVMGYSVQGQLPTNDTPNGNDNDPSSDAIYRLAQGTIPATADSLTSAGYLDLKRVLPMLGSVEALPLSVFNRLRIVIEYESDPNKILGNTANASSTIRAVLSYDEFTDDADKAEATRAFRGAEWDSIEHDLVVVSAGTNGSPAGFNPAVNDSRADQKVSANVKNYRGKYLKKLVVAKNPSLTAVFKNGNQCSPMGAYASITSLNEKINVKINGAPKLPLACDRPNKRLALLADSWGTTNAYPLNADLGSDQAYNILRPFDGASALATQVGVQDYFGIEIQDTVRDMQLEYERTLEGSAGANSESYHSQLNLNMWGLCSKAIVLSSGGYNVVG